MIMRTQSVIESETNYNPIIVIMGREKTCFCTIKT